MAAQIDANSEVPIQELVDLAVVWACQHGLVSTCLLQLLPVYNAPSIMWAGQYIADGVLAQHATCNYGWNRHLHPLCTIDVKRPNLQIVGAGVPEKPLATMHAPLTVLPTQFPRGSFEKAKAAMQLFNTLIDRVSRDDEYLQTTLRPAAQYDDFTVSCAAA